MAVKQAQQARQARRAGPETLGVLFGLILLAGGIGWAAAVNNAYTSVAPAVDTVFQQQAAEADAIRVGIMGGALWLGLFALFAFVLITDPRRRRP